jgi:hypothetical protein
MKLALEEPTAMLPEAKRTSTINADMASAILTRAAQGERDPIALKAAAILPSRTVRTILTTFQRIDGVTKEFAEAGSARPYHAGRSED